MKARFIILWCLVAALLCSCASGTQKIENEYYSIYNRDGKTYIEFTNDFFNKIQIMITFENISEVFPLPQFTSVSDMQQKIKSGDISPEKLAALWQRSDYNNVFEIYDPNNLYDLTLPNKVPPCKEVNWYGDYYGFILDLGAGKSGSVYVMKGEDTFNVFFEKDFVNYLEQKDQVLSDTVVEDRNARVVNYLRSNIGEFKDVFYTVTTPRGTILVRENYVVEYYGGYGGNYEASETVPKSVWLFGTEGESHFYARFMGLSYRPSVEWISSFGLVPYKAQNAS